MKALPTLIAINAILLVVTLTLLVSLMLVKTDTQTPWLDAWQVQHDFMMDNLPTLAPSNAP